MKVTIKDDRKCANPVGNVSSLMAIAIGIHFLTFVEIFESFNPFPSNPGDLVT